MRASLCGVCGIGQAAEVEMDMFTVSLCLTGNLPPLEYERTGPVILHHYDLELSFYMF